MSEQRAINRVIIYVRGKEDDWGDNVVALADVQIRYPYGALSAVKCLPIVQLGQVYGLIIPTVKTGVLSIPLFKGREIISTFEAAVLGTYNKVVTQCKPGEVWEQSMANDVPYFGKARKEYSNAQYRTVKEPDNSPSVED